MTKAKRGGYYWKQDLAQVRASNREIRGLVRRILDGNPGPQERAVLLTRIALATGASDDAIRDLERIGKG